MFEVLVTDEARSDFLQLPMGIQKRVQDIFVRLAKWPDVSGAKPLKHGFKGAYRVRTGDWRIIFRITATQVVVFRIAHRRDVYE